MIIGPRRSVGWQSMFSVEDMFVSPSFSSGSGSQFPLGSLPLPQVFRYLFSAQQWRWKCNIDFTGIGRPSYNWTYDSGKMPYSTGQSITAGIASISPRIFCSQPGQGDLYAAPRLVDRIALSVSEIFSVYENNDTNDNITVDFFIPQLNPGNGAIVIDDATAGNVFPAFQMLMSHGSTGIQLASVTGGGFALSPVTANLDSIPFDLFADNNPALYTLSGTFDITTYDT